MIGKYVINETMNEIITKISKKEQNRITFNDKKNKIFYIPNRDELFMDSIKDDLWWNKIELLMIKNQATYEFRIFTGLFPNLNSRIVSKRLWIEIDFDKVYDEMSFDDVFTE